MITINELHKLDRIITNDLKHFIQRQYPVTRLLIADFRSAIQKETARIKDNLAFGKLRYPTRTLMRHYIQQHQFFLIRLVGKLIQYNPPNKIIQESGTLDNTQLCHTLYDSLEELTIFVERQFPEYLDNRTWIPDEYRLIAVHDLSQDSLTIQNKLRDMGVRREIITLAFQPINAFVENPFSKDARMTYSHIIFLRKIKAEFTAFASTSKHEDPSESFQYLLLALNFNTLSYYTYCTDQIRSYQDEVSAPTEKIERMELVRKLLKQAPVRSGYAYNHNIAPLKIQLLKWVTQEVDYLKSTGQLELIPVTKKTPVKGRSRLVRTVLSVPQLAFAVRVIYDMKLLESKSLDFLMVIITQAFSTKEALEPSKGSFHNAYYGPDERSILAVRNLLLQMVHHIDRFIEKRRL